MAQESLSFVYPILVMSVHFSLAAAACGLGENAQAARELRKGLANGMACSPTFRRMCLPIAAILAARAGRRGWTAELLRLADAGPPAVIGWMDKWPLLHELRRQLGAQLGAVPYQTDWAHGHTLDLDTVTALIVSKTHRKPGKRSLQYHPPPRRTLPTNPCSTRFTPASLTCCA